ncbi:MAG: M12 family metallo-peptidase [Verrucomicrobiae bacterium]
MRKLAELGIPKNNVASLHVDAAGNLLYACEGLSLPSENGASPSSVPVGIDGAAGGGEELQAMAAPIPISTQPVRHSRAGAPNVLFLDFNGHTLTGTSWAVTRTCVPFDTDGDMTTFSDAEQAAIIRIWEAVAEDYKPFNVDVTTDVSTVFGPKVGRALITKHLDASGLENPYSTSGGISYVGVFGRSDYATYSPSFVYYDNVGSTAQNVAEVASHELGHYVGLSHDGTTSAEYYSGHGSGETSWAPIMGSGYGKNVTQWSKGEYYASNNPQDDLSILSGKLSYFTDDAVGTIAGAVAMGAILSGLIGSPADQDVYSFSTYTQAAVAITPLRLAGTLAGNLDVCAEVVNAAGTALSTISPSDTTTLNRTVALAPGTYYLRISGVGTGTPMAATPTGYTSYGSLGAYTITLTTDLSPYYQWMSSTGIAPASNGPLVDVEGNGILNIFRYAFGISAGSANQSAKMPIQGTLQQSGADYLTITFRRRISASNPTYSVQQSVDLVTWTAVDPVANQVSAPTANGDGTETLRVKSTLPINAGAPKVFLRVAVFL